MSFRILKSPRVLSAAAAALALCTALAPMSAGAQEFVEAADFLQANASHCHVRALNQTGWHECMGCNPGRRCPGLDRYRKIRGIEEQYPATDE